MNEDSERIIRVEKVQETSGFGNGTKGWLTLTTQRLVFSKNEKLGKDEKWSVALGDIESARAKKAFRAGVEVLTVTFRGSKGKREEKGFERMSWAQWANPVGRAEQNSFASFEQAVLVQRDKPLAAPPSPGTDVVSQLSQLAELHRSGAISAEEFAAAKAKLLA